MSSTNDDRPACGPGCACAIGNEFGERTARRELAAYRRKGPDTTTRWLIEGLRGGSGGDVTGLSVLDIGAGVGAVHLALLEAGAANAVDVDGSPAYIDAAREESARVGVRDRVTYAAGDFVDLAPEIAGADLVALDRVVCCYPDMRSLVELSVARADRRYGLVYPRDTWWIRSGATVANGFARLFRQRVRVFIHATRDVEAIVLAAGLTRRFDRRSMFWQVVVFER